jgi:hypothetical protein
MNTRNIQPITIFTVEGQKEVSLLSLVNFCGYDFLNGGGYVTYWLSNLSPTTTTINEDGNEQINPGSYTTVLENQLLIPSNIIQQWGADDDIIFVYVASALGLTII